MSHLLSTLLKRAPAIALLAVVLLGGAPEATAQSVDCDAARDQVANLVRRESRKGLSMGLQDQINDLVLSLESCPEPDTNEFETFSPAVRHWAPLVSVYFEPDDVERVLCLMELESAGDKNARNPSSGASGLMQVMPFWAGHLGYKVNDLFQPATNLQVASYILDQQGWKAWSPYVRGSCR